MVVWDEMIVLTFTQSFSLEIQCKIWWDGSRIFYTGSSYFFLSDRPFRKGPLHNTFFLLNDHWSSLNHHRNNPHPLCHSLLLLHVLFHVLCYSYMFFYMFFVTLTCSLLLLHVFPDWLSQFSHSATCQTNAAGVGRSLDGVAAIQQCVRWQSDNIRFNTMYFIVLYENCT